MELSYPSAQINKSVVSAIPPLGQVPCLMHQATAESILFIYRVLFAVHRNDLIYIPRQHNAAAPRYACLIPSNKIEALAALLSVRL